MPFTLNWTLNIVESGGQSWNPTGTALANANDRVAQTIAPGGSANLNVFAGAIDDVRMLVITATAFDGLELRLGAGPAIPFTEPLIASGPLLAVLSALSPTVFQAINNGAGETTVEISLYRDAA